MINENERSLFKSGETKPNLTYPEGFLKDRLLEAPWERRIATESGLKALRILNETGGTEPLPELVFKWKGQVDTIASNIFQNMIGLDDELNEDRLQAPTGDMSYVADNISKRNKFFSTLAAEIRSNQRYYLLEKLLIIHSNNDDNLPVTARALLTNDLTTLHLMIGREDRMLVGIKDGAYWKKIEWPNMDEYSGGLMDISIAYLFTAPDIGRRELQFVPEKPLTTDDLEKLRIPTPVQSIEESLEQAYYGQRYIVPPEGAEVRFNKAGDLEKLTLLQSRNNVLAKIETPNGETFSVIDLQNASEASHIPGNFGAILAEVYRDMVTAEFIHAHRTRRLDNLYTPSEDDEEKVQVTYIPRKVKIREDGDFRPKYEGPSRPVKPHRVSGHRRHVPMSEKHRQELQKFEEETGISVLENLPAGYTFVRPHVVPAGERLNELPIFIKKRIETRLKEELQRPAEEMKPQEAEGESELEGGIEVEVSKKRFPFRFPKFGKS